MSREARDPGWGALLALGTEAGNLLAAREETVAVAEGAGGGLVSAALLGRPGASSYYLGGTVIYTPTATRALLSGTIETPPDLRGATEAFARYLAESVARRLGATWGIGEGGAAGPTGNPYGDPAGHAWVAVWSEAGEATSNVLTGDDDRPANMAAFATAALTLLIERLSAASPNGS